jgi:uncharacterized glyoxalase superfamily protein PhnB
MKPPPKNWPRISSGVFYEDPAKAIDWLCHAFGFEVQMKVEGDDGAIHHSELVFGGGLVMVGGAGKASNHPEATYRKSPRALEGANTQTLFVYVDDVEIHFLRAKAAGAKIVSEPKTTDYGEGYWSDRTYQAEDPEGHRWWFSQRVRD